MGNRSSTRTDDWDSSEEGGSDYEHAYNYHTTVLQKSPADGFESDYEDEYEEGAGVRTRSQASSSLNNSAVASPSTPLQQSMTDGGDENNSAEAVTGVSSPQTVRHDQLISDLPAQAANGNSGDHVEGLSRYGLSRDCPQAPEETLRQVNRDVAQTRPENCRKTSPCVYNFLRQTGQAGGQTLPASIDNNNRERQTGRRNRSENEEVYETAGEGNEDDTDSLSTITPPRTRPQSDSDRGLSDESDLEEESDGEEEEEVSDTEDSEYDTVTENVSTRSARLSTNAQRQSQVAASRASMRSTNSRSRLAAHRPLPRRHDLSPRSYRQARKRPAPAHSTTPLKRSRPSDGINFSPNRTRYGVFDTDSESDAAPATTVGRGKRSAASLESLLPPRPDPINSQVENRPVAARTLRQAARKAASKFVETSRKILRDAKTAARILKESTSKRRSSRTLDEDEDFIVRKRVASGRRQTRSSAGNVASSEGSPSQLSPASRDRKTGVKRKVMEYEDEEEHSRGRKRRQRVEMDSDSDSEVEDVSSNRRSNSWRQVRKDGGRLRKFTRSNVTTTEVASRQTCQLPPSQPPSNHSTSLPLLPGMSSDRSVRKIPTRSSPRNTQLSSSFPSSHNPFENISLVPTVPKTRSTASIDSISHELVPPSGDSAEQHSIIPNPFVGLTMDVGKPATPKPLTFRAGSIWARINTGTNSTDHRMLQPFPVPGPSVVATATNPVAMAPPTAHPPRRSPRVASHAMTGVASLTLTGQFSHCGSFSFLLEDVLQVTVSTDSLTTVATKAIVIPADALMQHTSQSAQSVAKAAGSGFTQSCQDFLWRNAGGLQVCQAMEAPAGGQLPSQVSHILQVRTPDVDGIGSEEVKKQQKMLLCAYINCLKLASEKLAIPNVAFPLLGSESFPVHECIQVFFDSLLMYLAERTPTCPLHAIHLVVNNPAYCRFMAEVLEARLEAIAMSSIDTAMSAVFRDYFNIPDFSRNTSPPVAGDRSPSGKPAVKRRRL